MKKETSGQNASPANQNETPSKNTNANEASQAIWGEDCEVLQGLSITQSWG